MGKIKEGLYRCICGREFSKAQSYNAHLSHCKENLGDERYEKRIQTQRHWFKKANEVQSKLKEQARIEKHELAKKEWEHVEHFCETCGKLLPKKYEDIFGSGRYCNISCAAFRDHSILTKMKIAEGVNSCKSSTRYSTYGYYKGYYCASSYELIYLVYCLDHNINIERNKYTFVYNYEGKDHVYIPDWYLPDTNTLIECKGRGLNFNEELVNIKANSVSNEFNYKLLYEEDLKEYWEYCKETYNVSSYVKLCDLLFEGKPQKAKKTNWNVKENNPQWGKHWYNNGIKNIMAYSCPEGFVPGML